MILVAGGTGLVGSAIVRALKARGEEVAVMSHRPEVAAGAFPGLDVAVRAGDVQHPEMLGAAVAGCEIVVNTVQFPNYPTENEGKGFTFVEVDQRGTERLIAAAQTAGVRRFIYLSGVGAAPDAARHWFRAKAAAEQAVRESGLTYTIFRPAWVYGPADHALNKLAGFARGLPVVPVIGDGNQRLQPIFVDDVGSIVAESLRRPEAENRVFELGGPEVLTMNEIVRTMLEVMGKRKPLVHSPTSIMRLIGSVAGRLPNPPLSPEIVAFGTADAVAAPGSAQAVEQTFNLRLRPLREGLATYLAPAQP